MKEAVLNFRYSFKITESILRLDNIRFYIRLAIKLPWYLPRAFSSLVCWCNSKALIETVLCNDLLGFTTFKIGDNIVLCKFTSVEPVQLFWGRPRVSGSWHNDCQCPLVAGTAVFTYIIESQCLLEFFQQLISSLFTHFIFCFYTKAELTKLSRITT